MRLIPRYCIHSSGFAFVENLSDPDCFLGNNLREALQDYTKLVLSFKGYEVYDARTENLDPSIEKVLLVAEDIIDWDMGQTKRKNEN